MADNTQCYCFNSNLTCVLAGWGWRAATVAVLMLAVAVGAWPVKLEAIGCNTTDEYVYPFASPCDSPAQLYTPYLYASVYVAGLERMAPEYDITNRTYYVRFTDINAGNYVAAVARGKGGSLLVNSTVYIYNAETKRALQWRQEGTDEYFLIEQKVRSVTKGAPFRFLQAKDINIMPTVCTVNECQAYYLVSNPASASSTSYPDAGLLAYVEDGVTYIKAAPGGSNGDLPVFIFRSQLSAMPFPTIRTIIE